MTASIGSAWARRAYLAVGAVCFALGVVGALLPVLPTTPFMILALACFTRGSARLERWLLNHPRWGPPLRDWRGGRVIPLRVKLVAWGTMLASLGLLIATRRAPTWAIVVAAVAMGIGAWYIARCPSKRAA